MSITLKERTNELTTALIVHRDDVEHQKDVVTDSRGRVPESMIDLLSWSDQLQYIARALLAECVPLEWIRRYFEQATAKHVRISAMHNHGRLVPSDGWRYELIATLYNLEDAIYRYCAEYLSSVPGYNEMEYERQCYSF